MSESIEEAIAEAIAEIKSKDWVIDAEQDMTTSEDKPCNYVRKRLEVLHAVSQGDYTYSGKEFYINKGDFTYKWHYGGANSVETPFRDLLKSKEDSVKTVYSFDWVEITQCDEILESGTVIGIKTVAGNYAQLYTLRVWKIDDTTVGHKVVTISEDPTPA